MLNFVKKGLAVLSLALLTGGATAAPPPLDVLLLGYYIWAPDNFVDHLKEQENIHFYTRPDDRLAGDTRLYPLDFLKKFNVVIASGPLGRPWSPRVINGDLPTGLVDRLLEYRQAGGVVIWLPLGVDNGVKNWNEVIGSRIGAEAVNQQLSDPANTRSIIRPGAGSLRKLAVFTRTDNIEPHAVTEGVRNLFVAQTGEWSSQGTIPMRFGPDWQVLVRGSKTSTTEPVEKGDSTAPIPVPALVGLCEGRNGAGDMAVWPFYTTHTWGNYNHVAFPNVFLTDGDGKTPSDGEKLLVNLLRYTTRDQRNFGGFHREAPPRRTTAAPPDLSPVEFPATMPHNASSGKQQRGLIGLRTARGGGSGTVAEYAAEARKAGLDYIAFVEDVTKYDPESYARFVEECAKASSPELAVIPGYGGWDASGAYRFFVYALKFPEPDSGFLNAEGKIVKPGAVVTATSWGAVSSLGYFQQMPYDPWWNFVTMSGAVLVSENGKVVDHGVERWLNSVENNSSNLMPLSLVFVNRPADLAQAARDGFLTVLYGNQADALKTAVKSGTGGGVMPGYLSNGPAINYWGGYAQGPAPWRPNSDQLRVGVVVSSPNGLREVKIVDRLTGRVLRDWRPDGAREFREFIDLGHDRQQVLSLEVTDNAGRIAYGAPLYTFLDSNRIWLMGDRLMGMHHFTDWNEDRTALVGNRNGSRDITYVKTIVDACGSNPIAPGDKAKLKVQGFDGGNAYMPDLHLSVKAQPQGLPEERPIFQYKLKLAAHDLVVYEKNSTQKLVKGAKFDFNGTIPAMEPNTIADIYCRQWEVRQNYNSEYYILDFDITFVFKRDVKLRGIWLTRGSWTNAETEFENWFCRTAPGAELQQRVFKTSDSAKLTNQLQPGGYVYQTPILGGAPAFVYLSGSDPLTVTTVAEADREGKLGWRSNEFEFRFPGGREFKAGERYSFNILMATHKFDDAQRDSRWVDQLLRDFGIGSEPPWKCTLTRGKLHSIRYFIDLEAEDGGVEIEFPQYRPGQRLPVRVSGIDPNSICGEYNLLTRRVRQLPNFENRVFTTVDPQFGTEKYYLGELLRWNDEKLAVSLAPVGTDFKLTIHNPTDAAITAELSGAPGFAPLAAFRLRREIAPHQTVQEIVKTAPESIKLAPMR